MTLPPYDTGMLDVGDGQRIYYEQNGNPDGKPVVMLHGGPGGAPRSGMPGSMNAHAYRVIRFHQRGCGRSTPHVGDLSVPLDSNTTQALIGDIEALREHLGVQRWLVNGGSWGVTLGLAYAQAHPDRVTEALFISVTMTRAGDVHWLAHEAGRFFPEAWERFAAGVPADQRGDLVAAYDRLINHHTHPAVRVRAAHDWCDWEDALVSLDDDPYSGSRKQGEAQLICFARLVTHYFSHAGFLADGQLLRDAGRLAGIPGVLVHGRFDVQGPADVAWQLARAWPGAQLHIVRSGHSGNEEMAAVINAAFDAWAP